MELTRKLLEDKLTYVREQGAKAAAMVQQTVGAELMLRELLQEVLLREAVADAEDDELRGAIEAANEDEKVDEMNGLGWNRSWLT